MDTQIEQLHCRYRVIGAVPAPDVTVRRLDQVARQWLPEALGRALERALGADPAVYVLRQVDDRMVLHLVPAIGDAQLAQQWAVHLAGAALRRIVCGEDDQCVRFADQAEYVAAFVADLLAGNAWDRWYYGAFAELCGLDARATLRAVLQQHRADLPALLLALRRRGALEQLLRAMSEPDLRMLWAAARAPGADATPESLRPLFAAALDLLGAIDLAGQNRPDPEALFSRYLAGAPPLADWRDRGSLTEAFLATLGFLLRQERTSTPPIADPAALDQALASLDWLDTARIRAALPDLPAGAAAPPVPEPTADTGMLRPLFAAALRLAEELGAWPGAQSAGEGLFLAYLRAVPPAPDWSDRRQLAAAVLSALRFLWPGRPNRVRPVIAAAELGQTLARLDWLDHEWLHAELIVLLIADPVADPTPDQLWSELCALIGQPGQPDQPDQWAQSQPAIVAALQSWLSAAAPTGLRTPEPTLAAAVTFLVEQGHLERIPAHLAAALDRLARRERTQAAPATWGDPSRPVQDTTGKAQRSLSPRAERSRAEGSSARLNVRFITPPAAPFGMAVHDVSAQRSEEPEHDPASDSSTSSAAEFTLPLGPGLGRDEGKIGSRIAEGFGVTFPSAIIQAPGGADIDPARLQPFPSPRLRELIAALDAALDSEIVRLDRGDPAGTANALRLYAALLSSSPRWAEKPATPGIIRHLLAAWALLAASAAPSEALRRLRLGAVAAALELLPAFSSPGVPVSADLRPEPGDAAAATLAAIAGLGAPAIDLLARLIDAVDLGAISDAASRSRDSQGDGAAQPTTGFRHGSSELDSSFETDRAGDGCGGAQPLLTPPPETPIARLSAADNGRVVATGCAGLFLLLRAMQDLQLPALVVRAGWPAGGAPDPLSAAIVALGLRLAGPAGLVEGQIDPGLGLLAGLEAPPDWESLHAAWAATDQRAHARWQRELLRILAARRLLDSSALHLHQLDGGPGLRAIVLGDASGRLWPFGHTLAPADGPIAVVADRVAAWAEASGIAPALIDPAAGHAEAEAHQRSADGLVAALAALESGRLGLAATDLSLALAASVILRAWAYWLPRFAGSSVPYLLEQFIRRPGWVAIDSAQITVIPASRPLDVVIETAGYLADLEQVPWLGGRRVRFRKVPQ